MMLDRINTIGCQEGLTIQSSNRIIQHGFEQEIGSQHDSSFRPSFSGLSSHNHTPFGIEFGISIMSMNPSKNGSDNDHTNIESYWMINWEEDGGRAKVLRCDVKTKIG